jgi:hypothetical protein
MSRFTRYLTVVFSVVLAVYVFLLCAAPLAINRFDDSYLASLRENTPFGVSTFLPRRPRILFIGDSHTYAAWVFNQVSRILNEPSISSAAMGGFYFETNELLFKRFEHSLFFPKVIVLGTSLKQFSDSPIKTEQTAQHVSVITHVNGPWSIGGARLLLTNVYKWRKTPDLARPGSLERAQFETQAPKVEALSEIATEHLMQTSDSTDLASWLKFIGDVHFTSGVEEKIHAFCEVIKKRDIHLYVIAIPESPFLTKKYKAEDVARYHQILGQFKTCAKQVVDDPPESYGLGNRHFFNRPMADDFAYDLVNREVDLTKLPKNPLTNSQVFDADHMNLVGAYLFTSQAIERLKLRDESQASLKTGSK